MEGDMFFMEALKEMLERVVQSPVSDTEYMLVLNILSGHLCEGHLATIAEFLSPITLSPLNDALRASQLDFDSILINGMVDRLVIEGFDKWITDFD